MLYFSSEVKMEGPKEKWGSKEVGGGKKFFMPELGPPHFQFASYAFEFTTSVRLCH